MEKLYKIRTLLIFAFVFFIFRLLFVFIFQNNYHSVEDYRIADNIVKGIGFVNNPDIGPTAQKVPVYPLFIASFIYLFGSSGKLFLIIFQHLIMSSVPILLFMLGKEQS